MENFQKDKKLLFKKIKKIIYKKDIDSIKISRNFKKIILHYD